MVTVDAQMKMKYLQLFAAAVLGLSQGTLSEMLSKPKPWRALTPKGREPYVRMQACIADPVNVEKLQNLQSKRRGKGTAEKRKRSVSRRRKSEQVTSGSDSEGYSDADSANESSPDGSSAVPPRKKQRVRKPNPNFSRKAIRKQGVHNKSRMCSRCIILVFMFLFQ